MTEITIFQELLVISNDDLLYLSSAYATLTAVLGLSFHPFIIPIQMGMFTCLLKWLLSWYYTFDHHYSPRREFTMLNKRPLPLTLDFTFFAAKRSFCIDHFAWHIDCSHPCKDLALLSLASSNTASCVPGISCILLDGMADCHQTELIDVKNGRIFTCFGSFRRMRHTVLEVTSVLVDFLVVNVTTIGCGWFG